jgi:N-methylhydantoinase A/oxoprolinase/acetone carboxylase beta subunit
VKKSAVSRRMKICSKPDLERDKNLSTDYIIGIDTGGTYTDAVVIDRASQRILASAKSLTTKGDLAVGVGLAMREAVSLPGEAIDAQAVKLVSISTTLATNAVVEGHGGAAAAVLIGFDDRMAERTGIASAFPDMPILRIEGGHDHNGLAVKPLDVNALRRGLDALAGKVTSIAIASTFAVRNNQHEMAARDVVAETLSLPVTLSSELSSALDAPRRALTAVLNARLIGHSSKLIAAVKRAMAELRIVCPLMIMKGDGALALADSIEKRPIETILSGPAASLMGAKWLSGMDDFIVSDMGGTTTDVGILEKGRPLVAPLGAEVGGWRTMVKAIDIKTIGLGGDSEVSIGTNGRIEVGPQRAVPLSLLASRAAQTIALLEADLADTEGASLHGRFLVLPFGKAPDAAVQGLNGRELEIHKQLTDVPLPLRRVATSTAAQRAIASLRRKGLVQLCAFTPSDAAHALQLQDNWSTEAAQLSAQLLYRFRYMRKASADELRTFCHEIWDTVVALSARIVLETALGEVAESRTLVDAVCAGRPLLGRARISIAPVLPIVAVGGPVRIYYHEVAERLGTDVVFTSYCDVANAVGAASALVLNRVTVTVEGNGQGLFRVHGGGHSEEFGSGSKALANAVELATRLAKNHAVESGAVAPRCEVSVSKTMMPEAQDDEGLLTATVIAEAAGRPA